MSVTSVVLNYNNYNETIDCVQSLRRLKAFEKIVIVDNASTDDSLYQFRNLFDEAKDVIILNSNYNGGYAAGNNLGLRYLVEKLSAEFIMICNPDVRIDNKEVITKMYNSLQLENNIAAVAPRMLDNNGEKVGNGWKIPTFFNDIILSVALLVKVIGNPTNYKQQYLNSSHHINVEVLSGACFMVKRGALLEVGYLDEKTFLYCEERILAKKLKELGYKQVLLNDCSFNHFHSTTISKNIKSNVKRYLYLSQSRYYYQVKYNRINILEKVILRTFINIGILEQIIFQAIKNIPSSKKIEDQ